jgi:DNA-binding NarL/FixJ family response regulator
MSHHDQRPRPEGCSSLTDRERQILQVLATGANNRQIARQLHIAEGTVRKHLEHAYAKLGVSTRTAALVKVLTTSTS